MARSKLAAILLALFGLVLAGCGTSGPRTAIVREVEAAGGGDAATVSPGALRHWFLQHRNFATHVWEECASSSQSTVLNYTDTTEGKVCGAAYDMRIQRAGRDGVSF